MSHYRGVVLEESLADETVLSEIVVEKEKKREPNVTSEQPEVWTWIHIRVPEEDVERIAQRLSKALKPRAWYTNLWLEGDYLLIFPNKIFRSSSIDDSIWKEAIEYGQSIGVPIRQLMPLDRVLHTA